VPRHEYVIVFSKGDWKLEGDRADCDITAEEFMETTRSVWNMGTASRKRIGHPAPFPEKLPERLIKYYCYRGNTVLDMFGGSGTVGVVARRLGRHFILIDNSREYCELARRRFEQATGLFDRDVPPVVSLADIGG
jgi:site-specific DNA-methyltransferase (adenine-specific)